MADKIRAAAHDLRSPVTSAVSLMELLNTEENPEERKAMQAHLQDSLGKLKGLVDEILESKDAGRELMELSEVDFYDEIDEVLDLVRHYPGFRNTKIEVDVEQKAPLVSDKKYLHVILSNLLSNAIKYADNSKPYPYIKIAGQIDEEQMDIEVKDNGIGIGEEQLPKIFRKNVRATDVSEGTGIGLSLVKRTVAILEGDVRISSEIGVGTTARLYINNFQGEL
jgi:signal transduction histidine kinase